MCILVDQGKHFKLKINYKPSYYQSRHFWTAKYDIKVSSISLAESSLQQWLF